MMFTTNKILLNTSVLIEALKGNKTRFYHSVISDIRNECCINETIVSEYLFHFLAFFGGASPRTLKEKSAIPGIIQKNLDIASALSDFTLIPADRKVFEMVPAFMLTYNLLPNDAIILATCKIHGITQLASHDSDFILPCAAEGIELLREN